MVGANVVWWRRGKGRGGRIKERERERRERGERDGERTYAIGTWSKSHVGEPLPNIGWRGKRIDNERDRRTRDE